MQVQKHLFASHAKIIILKQCTMQARVTTVAQNTTVAYVH